MTHNYAPDACQGCPIKVVCRCLNVTEAEVVTAITTHDLQTVRELRDHTGAGDGCTCCHGKLKYYLAAYQVEAAVAG
jgi:NAD(P)H-nitrite reductase large subunit